MKRTFKIVLIFLGLTFFVLAYSNKGIFPKDTKEGINIAVVFKDIEHVSDFWKAVKAGIETAAKEFNVNIEYRGADSESNYEMQIDILNAIIREKPDAVVMAASDYDKLISSVESIRNAEIKLVTIDSGINSDAPFSFIATDNIEAGRKAGKELKRIIGDEGKVAIVSYVKGSATAIDREKGVREGMELADPNKLLGIFFCDDFQSKAFEITKSLLEEYPDLKGIACLNENATIGAANAVKELGLGGKVKLVGFDSSAEEVQLIEEEIIQAIVVQKPFNMGYLGIKTAVQCLEKQTVDKRINTGSELVTKETMFSEENQKLLFPFIEE